MNDKSENKFIKRKILRNLKERWFYYCFMSFVIIQFLIFYVGVNFNSIILAFTKYNIDPQTNAYVRSFASFDNFINIIKSFTNFNYAFKNSFVLCGCNLFIGVPLALLFSYYIFKKWPLSKMFQIVLYLPSIVSSIALVLIYTYLVEKGIPEIVEKLTGVKIAGLLNELASDKSTVFSTILFYNLWTGFGVNVIMYSNAMAGVSVSILEAGQVDGVNALQEFINIILPRIYGTVVVFIVSSLSVLFTNQMHLVSFKGIGASPELQTIGYYLYSIMKKATTTELIYPELSAFGLILTFILVPIVYIVRTSLYRFGPKDV